MSAMHSSRQNGNHNVPSHQNVVQVGGLYWHNTLGAHAHGDVVEQRLRELLFHGQDILQGEVRPHQPDAAVYVEAHAAWGVFDAGKTVSSDRMRRRWSRVRLQQHQSS